MIFYIYGCLWLFMAVYGYIRPTKGFMDDDSCEALAFYTCYKTTWSKSTAELIDQQAHYPFKSLNPSLLSHLR